jgi:Ca2+-binding EF-hand superfamily protein
VLPLFDKDGDGVINVKEFTRILRAKDLEEQLTPAEKLKKAGMLIRVFKSLEAINVSACRS